MMKGVVRMGVTTGVRLFGRSRVARLTRLLNNQARLDVLNSPTTNGEYLLIRALAPSLSGGSVVIDGGANVGEWTTELLRNAQGVALDCHLFEPSAITASELAMRLPKSVSSSLTIRQLALSDTSGAATLAVVHPLAGVNSMAADPGATGSEAIRTTTIDEYCDGNGIATVAFLKLDLEGWDCVALEGAKKLLAGRRIAAVQFEYNWRWINARRYLRDAFELLAANGYQVGKVTPIGLEMYEAWTPDLESFVEGNFVALLPETVLDIRRFSDWREVGS